MPLPASSPFVLNYLSKDTVGVMAYRPATAVSDPSMKPAQQLINKELKEMLNKFIGNDGPSFALEQIEQAVNEFRVRPKTRTEEGAIFCGFNVIRLIPGARWQPFLTARFPKMETVQHGKGSYFRVPLAAVRVLDLNSAPKGESMCGFLPDERTLVFATETQIRQWLTEGLPAMPSFAWSAIAQTSNAPNCVVAICVDGQRMHQAMGFIPPEDAKIRAWATLLAQAESLVFTCTTGESIKLQLTVQGTDHVSGKALGNAVQEIWKPIREAFPNVPPLGKEEDPAPGNDVLAKRITVTHEFKMPLGTLLAAIQPELFAAATEPDHQFLAQTHLIEVPVAVLEKFRQEHLSKEPAKASKEPYILTEAQTKALLEAVQGDKRATVLSRPQLITLPGQTAFIQVGENKDKPDWRCKVTMNDAPNGQGILLDVNSTYNDDGKTLRPVTPDNQAKSKRQGVVAWSCGAQQVVPPGHSMLLFATAPGEKSAPSATTILLLVTPSPVFRDLKPPVK
jgi:hypothetical protein